MAGLRGSSWGLGLAVGLSLGKVDLLLSASLKVTVYEGRADTTQGYVLSASVFAVAWSLGPHHMCEWLC